MSLLVFHFKLVKTHKYQLRIGRGMSLVFFSWNEAAACRPPSVVWVSFRFLSHPSDAKITMQRIQRVLNVKAQHPTESPVANLCHLLVGPLKNARYRIPERGVLGFFQAVSTKAWAISLGNGGHVFFFYHNVHEEVCCQSGPPSVRNVCIFL